MAKFGIALIALSLLMAAFVAFFSHKIGQSFENHLADDPYFESCKKCYLAGKKAGALVVINQNRKAEGEEPFCSWQEFENYSKDSDKRVADIEKWWAEFQEDNRKRGEAKKKYPRPWLNK